MMSIKDEHIFTSSITQTKILKSSELNTLNENSPEINLTTPIPRHMKICQVKQPTVHTDLFQKSEPVEYKNICMPYNIEVRTRSSKPSNLYTFYENYPNTHKNILATSTPTFVKIYPVENSSTPQLNTVPLIHTYLHKKFKSTVQIGNIKHRINRTLFHQMISKPSETSIKLISSTQLNNNIGEY